jgi:hypothetical protein
VTQSRDPFEHRAEPGEISVKIMWTDAAADHLQKGKLFRQKTEEPRGNITKQLENVAKRTATV